jgi:hypothetical protein
VPVQKFRTFAEATRALVQRRGSEGQDDDAMLPARVAALWAMSGALAAPLAFRGVRKFRTIEEAGADRDRMTIERSRTPA